MAYKKKAVHQPFEGRDQCGRFVKVTHDMMGSHAWQVLNLRQRGLYLELKARYAQKVIRGILAESNQEKIEFPRSAWEKLYGDYRTFSGDMNRLIELGFIRVTSHGKNVRRPNLYGFTDDWKTWEGS